MQTDGHRVVLSSCAAHHDVQQHNGPSVGHKFALIYLNEINHCCDCCCRFSYCCQIQLNEKALVLI